MNQILQAIYDTLEEVNRQLPDDQQMQKLPDTIVVGDNGALDSLGVINFLIALEDRLSRETGNTINLLDEKIISESDGPLKTIGRLHEYIESRL
jgi:acyl carrier protein